MNPTPERTTQRKPFRRRVVVALGLILVGFLVFLVATHERRDESLFEGRRVCDVIDGIVGGLPGTDPRPDRDTLARIGLNRAIPELSRHLFHKRLVDSADYASTWKRLPGVIKKFFPKPQPMRRLFILQLLVSSTPRNNTNCLPVAIKLLGRNEGDSMRSLALSAIEHAGTNAKPAFPALTNLLGTAGVEFRGRIFQTIARFGEDFPEMIPLVLEGLNDPDPAVRDASGRMLRYESWATNAAYRAARERRLQ